MRQRNLHVTVKKLLSKTQSSKNWKQKYCFACRHRKLLQSNEFWHMNVRNLYWAQLLFIAFVLLLCWAWTALLAIAVCFIVWWQVRTLVIQCDSGAWFYENIVGNLTRARKFIGLAGDFVSVIDAASTRKWLTCVRVEAGINQNAS